MEHELCHVHTEHCFSGQTGHHEHRRQEMTDAITRTTKYLMVTTTYKHTVDATVTVECRCLIILAWMCNSALLNKFSCCPVLAITRSCAGFASVSLFSCKEASDHGKNDRRQSATEFRDICQQTTLATSDLSSLQDLELLEDHLRAKYSGAVEDVLM